MKRRLQLLLLVLGVTAIAAATGALVSDASVTPGSVTPSRTLSTNDIVACDGTTDVTVTLANTIGGAKTEVLLVLDQSTSVNSTLATSRNVANSIIDGIDLRLNKVGIVAFSSTAVVKSGVGVGAITDKAALKTLVNTLPTSGGTNHADAFLKAQAAFSPSDKHVIVMITDGKTTKGNISGTNDVEEANKAALDARTAGTAIFTVRLGSSSTTIDSRLKGWASVPDTKYFRAASPSAATEIVAEIDPGTPAATNAKVVDTLNADFDFVSWPTGVSVSGKTLTWNAGDLLGTTQVLTYTVKHDKNVQVVGVATKKISASAEYTSDQQQLTPIRLLTPANNDVFVRPCGDAIGPPKACVAGTQCTLGTTAPDALEGTGQTGVEATTTGNSTLFLTKLDRLSFEPKGCPGFKNQFVQLDALPLTDKLVVSVDLPAPTGPGPLLDLAKICLGTNLPFVTRSFGLAQKEQSNGLFYGWLPYGPRLTKIGDKWVKSPFISLIESRNIITIRGTTERVTHIVFEVQSVGILDSNGRPGYDPMWGG
jgi:hypothetical protein